jgi:flagellar FliL protein
MATTTANQQTTEAPRSSRVLRSVLLLVVVALAAAGAAGAGTYFFVTDRDATAHSMAPATSSPLVIPVFFALDPMTVNLQSDDGLHYLRAGVSLKVNDILTQERLAAHMPEIRSRILLALSNKRPEDLETLEGKHALANELKTLIEAPTEHGGPSAHIQDVLFTEFVVQ